jgi:uncharacterized delta-60 repeat protein
MRVGSKGRGGRGRLAAAAVLALLLLLLAASTATARPGQVDRSFGHHGIGDEPLEPHFEQTSFTEIEEAADGSLLAIRDGLTRRYSPTGRLDPGFPPQRLSDYQPLRLVQPDGKVLEPGEAFKIKRLNPDGTLDQSFHGGESEETGIFSLDQLQLLPSGKILLAGSSQEVNGKSFASDILVVRLNADGTLDRTFGGSGVVSLRHYEHQVYEAVPDLLVQADGALLVVTPEFVTRLGPDGTVDGAYEKAAANLLGQITILAARPSGEAGVAVAGWTGTCCSEARGDDFFVAHLGPDGGPDRAYSGGAGIARIDGGADRADAALFASDGSVLLGGGVSTITPGCLGPYGCQRSSPAVASFDSAGNPDRPFGGDGLVQLERLDGAGAGASVAVVYRRPDGTTIAAGSGGTFGTVGFLAGLRADGELDSSFGDDGVVEERRPEESEQTGPPEMAVAPGGKILAAVENNAGPVQGPSVIRYTRDGRLDRAFGDGHGFATFPYGNVAALASDRAGGTALLTEPAAVALLTPRGRVSRRFNGGRPVALRRGEAHFHDLAIQPDGKVLVVGTSNWLDRGRMLVVRLLPNGELDPSFGNGGHAVVGCRRRGICKAKRILLQPDGRILLAGEAEGLGPVLRYSEEPSRLALARLLSDGRPDPSFGGDGFVAARITKHAQSTAITLRKGEIVVAGWALPRHGSLGLLARFRMDGSLDRGFGREGVSRGFPSRQGIPTELFSSGGRLIAVMKEDGPYVLGFRGDGRRDPSYRQLPGNRILSGLVSGPGATLQGGKVVLGWTRASGKNAPIQLRLTRLQAR